jgi:hypothetical protein
MSIIGFCLVDLLLFAASLHAEDIVAPEGYPEAPGSIAGVVTDIHDAPLADIDVSVYRRQGDGSWYTIRSEKTSLEGAYWVALLGAGVYRVGFRDPQNNLADVYYDGVSRLEDATDLVITGNHLTAVNAAMPVGGRITGIITSTNGSQLYNPSVHLLQKMHPLDTPAGQEEWTTIRIVGVAPGESTYNIDGITGGVYRVCASGYSNSGGDFSECYDNVADVRNGTDVAVTPGVTVTGIDFRLGDRADRGEISGSVVAPSGDPLSAVLVSALMRHPEIGWLTHFITETDTTGFYKIPMLISATYALQFTDPQYVYAAEYYDNALVLEAATLLPVPPKTRLTEINATLEPSGHITGAITVLGEMAAPSASVFTYLQVGDEWRQANGASVDSQTGHYDVPGLAPGVYRICATSNNGESSYFGCYGGTQLDEANDLTINAGDVQRGINFNLAGGSTYSAEIRGRVTVSGTPHAGIRANLYLAHSCCDHILPTVYIVTDADGSYAIPGLAGGSYYVGFIDPDGVYAANFYPDSPSLLSASPILISDMEIISNVNGSLVLGGSISGNIHQQNGDPAANLKVLVYWRSAYGYSSQPLPFGGITDATGAFTVQGLTPGAYRLCFTQRRDAFPEECYGSPSNSIIDASDVTVEAGKVTGGIDHLWGPDFTQYLPFVGK